MRFPRILGAAILIRFLVGGLSAQDKPHFEVATIKPATPGFPRQGGTRPAGNVFSVPATTLRALITIAYGREFGANVDVEGGPAWIDKDRFEIVAAAAEPLNLSNTALMLQQLLADRFGLKVHTETREKQVLALVPARRDGKLGPKVKPWGGTCPFNAPPQPKSKWSARCSAFFRPPGIEIVGGSMEVVADLLSSPQAKLGRPVVDRTGISGEFDMPLEFDFNADDPRNPNRELALLGPSLVTAIEEQWGLKLIASKDTLTILVVDAATPPTQN